MGILTLNKNYIKRKTVAYGRHNRKSKYRGTPKNYRWKHYIKYRYVKIEPTVIEPRSVKVEKEFDEN